MELGGIGPMGDMLGIFWGYIGDMLGICWDNGKENGNDCLVVFRGQ